MLDGRLFVTTDDIRAVAQPVLRHRVITNFNAESSGVTPDKVIDKLIEEVPERRPGDEIAPELKRAFA
jgi:MoxR-like ATPase